MTAVFNKFTKADYDYLKTIFDDTTKFLNGYPFFNGLYDTESQLADSLIYLLDKTEYAHKQPKLKRDYRQWEYYTKMTPTQATIHWARSHSGFVKTRDIISMFTKLDVNFNVREVYEVLGKSKYFTKLPFYTGQYYITEEGMRYN